MARRERWEDGATTNTSGPTQRRYPAELCERVVRTVRETIKETGQSHGVITRVSIQLGIGSETLRGWMKKAEIDEGLRPRVTTDDKQRLRELELSYRVHKVASNSVLGSC